MSESRNLSRRYRRRDALTQFQFETKEFLFQQLRGGSASGQTIHTPQTTERRLLVTDSDIGSAARVECRRLAQDGAAIRPERNEENRVSIAAHDERFGTPGMSNIWLSNAVSAGRRGHPMPLDCMPPVGTSEETGRAISGPPHLLQRCPAGVTIHRHCGVQIREAHGECIEHPDD